MTPARLRWGLLFITVGVMVILSNLGHLDWDYWWELALWWPLLLIAIGIEKVFLKTKLQFISYLAPLVLVGAMVVVAVDVGGTGYGRSGIFESHRWNKPLDEKVQNLKVILTHDRMDLYVDKTVTKLVSARFDDFIRKPSIDYDVVDGEAELDIRARNRSRGTIYVAGRRLRSDWRINLTDQIPVDIKCSGRKSDVNLRLDEMIPGKITIDNDDGSIYLKLGTLSTMVDIDITGYDSNVRIKIPEGVGVKVNGDQYAGYLEEIGYLKKADNYCTENFETANIQVMLTLDDELGNLSISDY
jgi:hypothetical protein